MDQAWLDEDQAQPEAGYPTESIRRVQMKPGIPNLRYLRMSSKPILPKVFLLILFPHLPAFVCAILLTQLCGSPAPFRDTERQRKPERKRKPIKRPLGA